MIQESSEDKLPLFSEKFHDIPGSEQAPEFLENWTWFREFRSQILKEIEIKREQGLIGH